jgi:hypothetical protein
MLHGKLRTPLAFGCAAFVPAIAALFVAPEVWRDTDTKDVFLMVGGLWIMSLITLISGWWPVYAQLQKEEKYRWNNYLIAGLYSVPHMTVIFLIVFYLSFTVTNGR